jgi:hypothetical protein
MNTRTVIPAARPVRLCGLGPLVAAQVLSGTGAWSALIAAQTHLAFRAHGGSWALTALASAWGVPPIALRRASGALLIRLGPRPLGAAAAAVAAACAGALALVPPERGTLLALMSALGCAKALLSPALDTQAAWRRRGGDASADSVWLTLAAAAPLVSGPILATAVSGPSAPTAAFTAAATAYLLAGVGVLLVPATRPIAKPCDDPAGCGAERQAAPHPRELVSVLRLSAVAWFGYGAFNVLEPVFVRDSLHGTGRTFALLTVVSGLGGIPMGAAVRRLPTLLRAPIGVPAAAALVGATQLAYVGTGLLPVAVAASTAWGATAGLLGAASRTRLLILSPTVRHGEVISRWRAAQALGTVLPLLGVATAADAIGARTALVVVSILTLAAGAAACVPAARTSAHNAPARQRMNA